MKTEVYSWRVSAALKSDLERAARKRNISIASALDIAAREWLGRSDTDEQERQRILHQAISKCVGTISGTDPNRSANVSKLVREKIRKKYGR